MTPSERDSAILSLEKQVIATARYILSRIPSSKRIELFDEFVQAGWVGAIKAVDDFKPEKGALKTYASSRIRGEILDHMRTIDPLSRTHRQEIKGADLAPQTLSLAQPLIDKKGDSYHFDVEDHRALDDFARSDARHDVCAIFRKAALDRRRVKVISRYYFAGDRLQDIAAQLHVGESRAAQIHADSIERARSVI